MDTKTNVLIGRYLKDMRMHAGLTQEELATRCHVAQSFVSKLEQGERSLKFIELFDYSKALEINPEEVYDESRNVLLRLHIRESLPESTSVKTYKGETSEVSGNY
jgi:transcriptional regulator with XRE-family HTH domain